MLNLNPEQRFSIYYFALFASIGSVAPFFAVWLDSLGIDAETIGLIAAAPSLCMIFTTVFIGRWSDALNERRTAIIVCNALILALQILFFWPVNTWLILIVWTLSGILMFAMVPVTDAAAISITTIRNTDYARVRMFGSVGFIVAVATSGYLYEAVGILAFVPVLLAGNLLRLGFSTLLPDENSARQASTRGDPAVLQCKHSSLFSAGVLLTVVGSSLIQSSHAVVYTFGILLWSQQQISESTGSLLIAIGVVAEVVLMWRFRMVANRLSARGCLFIAAVCGILRWTILAMSPPVILIYVAQLLHGVTFGLTFLATALFISRRVGEVNAARGQGLSATVMTACMALTTYLAGHLFERLGLQLYWLMGGLCGAAILCLLLSYLTRLDQSEGPGR